MSWEASRVFDRAPGRACGNTPPASDGILARRFLWILAAYFICHIFARCLFSHAVELDEAEQMVLSQWLLPGYFTGPPLYTWIQAGFFHVLGLTVPALSIFKNLLLFLTYTFVFLSARRLLGNTRLSLLPSVALIFSPSIAWASQRDLSHTVIATTFCAITFFQVTRLLDKRSTLNFILLGVVCGLGTLTKYNYLIFLVAVLVTLSTYADGRRIVLDPRFVLTALIALGMAFPHVWWALTHRELVTSTTYKLQIETHPNAIKGLGSLSAALGAFLGLPCLMYLLLMPGAYRRQAPAGKFPFARFFLITVVILLALVLIFKVTFFRARWFQPVLFLFPLYLTTRLDPAAIQPVRWRWFLRIGSVFAVVMVMLMLGRILAPDLTGKATLHNFPNREFAEDIRRAGFQEGLILSDEMATAANLLMWLPGSVAVTPELRKLVTDEFDKPRDVLVVWTPGRKATLPVGLRDFVKAHYKVEMDDLNPVTVRHRSRWSTIHTEKIVFAILPASGSAPEK